MSGMADQRRSLLEDYSDHDEWPDSPFDQE